MSALETKPLFTDARRRWVLGLLVAIYTSNYIDRIIVPTLGQSIKQDLHLTDFQFGILGGLAFALFFAALGVPIARLAERVSRVSLMVVCIALWSVMTALCGATTTYLPLLLCRMGVGVGEAGCTPTSQSLISDWYPPNRRSSALAVFGLGVPIGMIIGAGGGGWIAQNFSWRTAFVIAAAPGVVLAILAAIFLREPPRGHADGLDLKTTQTPSLLSVLRHLAKRPAFIHITIGCTLISFANNATGQFLPQYFSRVFGLTRAEAGTTYGLVMGSAGLLGVYGGGVLAQWLNRADRRWYAWTPALGALLGAPCYLIAFAQNDWRVAAAMILLAGAFMFFNWAPSMAAAQNMAEPRMRASVAALLLLSFNLIGTGGGPMFAGFFSDFFANHAFAAGNYSAMCPGGLAAKGAVTEIAQACSAASATGLHHSMVASSLIFLWAMVHYLLAAKTIRRDLNPEASAN